MDDEIQFVITAPVNIAPIVAYENSVRQTHGVLIDMFVEANEYIVLAAPYLKDFEFANRNLHNALLSALKRKVTLIILTTMQSLDSLVLDNFKDHDVQFLVPQSNISNDNLLGSHAKFCIADGKSVYLGSANFTFSGFHRQFEMGIYSRGVLAQQVESFWNYLKDNDIFVRITK